MPARANAPLLFTPLTLRGVTLRNRVVISPMMQHASPGGIAQPWLLVHLGKFALGGAGLVFTEATAVVPEVITASKRPEAKAGTMSGLFICWGTMPSLLTMSAVKRS